MAVRHRRLAIFVLVILVQGTFVFAQQKPAVDDRVLPDMDVRDGLPVAAPDSLPDPAARLRASGIDAAVARRDPRTGTVRALFASTGALSSAQPGAPRAIARRYLLANADLFGLTIRDVNDLQFVREYTTAATGLRHVFFTQIADGIPVFDSSVSVHLARDGSVLRVNSNAISTGVRQNRPTIAAFEAVVRAAADIRPEAAVADVVVRPPQGPSRSTAFAGGSFARDVEANLTWLPISGSLRLAWQIALEPTGLPQVYDVLIDASNGERLLRRNRVRYADGYGRVLQAAPAPDPRRPDPRPFGIDGTGSTCPPVSNHVPRSLNLALRDSAFVLGNSGRLAGNNAHVYRRTGGVEGAMGTFDGASWDFDFPFNTADAAETTLFFATNFAHDFFYDLGFDEAAGNFQLDNFGRGGSANDPVRALARATGRNNATWANAADGQSPTMSMFLWDGTGCWAQDVDGDGALDLDGDFDSDIVIHEYHHGVSLRLNTSFSGPEAGAMGEGGGDFFAYSINGDTVLAEYSYQGGIRGVNGKTYANWSCLLGIFCEVHDNGEIWANVLWDVRERFRTDLVRGSGAGAIDESHRIYIDGLKLSPPSPSMLDLRDAMLQADAFRNPDGDRSANYCRLWESFATRGMGVNAVDSSASPLRQVVADFTVPDGCNAPPAPPSVTIAPAIATAYEAGTVPGSVQITRDGDTGLPLIVAIGRSGSASATDYAPIPTSVTIPEGASSVTLSITPVDDAIVEPNETVTISVLPGGGYAPGSPSSATITIVSDDVAPDLQISGLTAPATAAAGTTIAISDTTANTGAGGAPQTRTVFYLSLNFSVDASDVVLAERTVAPLASGGTSQETTPAQIPAATVAGTYYIIAKADADNVAAETSEYNNIRSATIRIGPDLVISAMSAPQFGAPGGAISVNETTANQGSGEAGSSTTRFYLSANFSYDSGDVPLNGSRPVASLASGATSAGTTSVTIPAGTATGTYYLIARADADERVPETTETNNTRWTQLQVGGDLIVSALSAPSRAAAGATIAVTDGTRNQGSAATGASTTAFYLSSNYALDSADVRLGPGRGVPGLAAGTTSTGTTMVTLPATLSVGTWVLFARADADGAVVETQEGNNTRFATIQVGPDLTFVSFSAPTSGIVGSAMTLSDTVTNRGASTADPSRVRYYFSLNTLLDAGDTPVAEARDVPALEANASSSGTRIITVPGGLAAGPYYLIAVADGDGTVTEVVETNNTAIRFIQLTR